MPRVLILIGALLVSRAAAAQPFLYSLSNQYCPAGPPCPSPRLVVTNARTGVVVNADDAPLFSGDEGVGTALTVTPDGARIYVSVNPILRGRMAAGRIVVINTATYRPIASVQVTSTPWFLVPSPDGRTLYGSNPLDGVVMMIDTATNQVTRTLKVEQAFSLAISSDGNVLAVTQTAASQVALLDTRSGNVLFRTTVPQYPQRIAMSADGGRLYVATSGPPRGNILIIDTVTGEVTVRAQGSWSTLPGRLLVTPDDKKVYVTFTSAGAWGVLSPNGDMTVYPAAVPAFGSMVPSADWRHLYIEGTDGILVIDTATDTVEQTLPGGSDLNISPAGGCQFTLPAQDAVFGPAGGTGTIDIPAPAGCEWAIQNTPSQDVVRVTAPASGVGPGKVTYTVAPSGSPRAATIRIAGQTTRLSVRIPQLAIDAPAQGAVLSPPFVVGGWTIEQATDAVNAGIDIVHVWAVPVFGGKAVFLGAAANGGARPDVGGVFGAVYSGSGFGLSVRWLTPGAYHIAVYGRSRATGLFTAARVVTVTVTGESRVMSLDTLRNGAVVDPATAAIHIGGWAIDRSAPAGAGVDLIHVWAYPVEGGTPRFLGAAATGVNRPDVAAVMGAPYAGSGFSTLVTKPPAGTYWVSVYARSTTSGLFEQWRTVMVTFLP